MGILAKTLYVGVAFAAAVVAHAKYDDPDSPDVDASAKAALSDAKVIDIIGIARGIDTTLKDLGAKITDREIRLEIPADVLFDFDSAALRPDAAATLVKISDVLKGCGTSPVTIEGHTDSKGSDTYNQKLSERRAASVKNWLSTEGGVAAGRLAAHGIGESRPAAPNTKPDGSDDPENRQKNRRVEIVVKKG